MFHVKPDNQSKNPVNNSLINADRQTTEKLTKYLVLIKQWSKKMNLISSTDKNDIFRKHFIPSFWFFEALEIEEPKSILDIGSGAGFPGLILKILSPKSEVYLVESNRKKTLFLREVSEQLDIFPIIINDRIENFIQETDKTFDVIVSRAVTSLNKIWDWSINILNKKGSVYIIKGKDCRHELIDLNGTNLKISTIEPGSKWINNSQNLKNKMIIKLVKT